jgi:predicted restriction endonuclease
MRHFPPKAKGASKNATSWNGSRDRAAQARFRRIVLRRDNYTCRRCGRQDPTGKTFEAHHVSAGYSVECGLTLCDADHGGCHREVDGHAR